LFYVSPFFLYLLSLDSFFKPFTSFQKHYFSLYLSFSYSQSPNLYFVSLSFFFVSLQQQSVTLKRVAQTCLRACSFECRKRGPHEIPLLHLHKNFHMTQTLLLFTFSLFSLSVSDYFFPPIFANLQDNIHTRYLCAFVLNETNFFCFFLTRFRGSEKRASWGEGGG
jgi:hypothetical protein